MTWDPTVKFGDAAIVFATILGPILAVQAQKAVERWRDNHNRKMWIFQTLMATRAARLTAEHVRALNMIDLVFFGKMRMGLPRRSKTEQAVLDSWKEYLDDLEKKWDTTVDNSAREQRRTDIFVSMLMAIGEDVGYKFDRVQIARGGYLPTAHGDEYTEQQRLRKLAIKLLGGDTSLKMDVASFPSNPEGIAAVIELYKRLNLALNDKGALTVKVKNDSE